jgi:porin
VLPACPDDTFGVGWSRMQFSDNLVPFLRDALGLGLGRDDASGALYYNVAAAIWLGLMVELEAVKLGLKKTRT